MFSKSIKLSTVTDVRSVSSPVFLMGFGIIQMPYVFRKKKQAEHLMNAQEGLLISSYTDVVLESVELRLTLYYYNHCF